MKGPVVLATLVAVLARLSLLELTYSKTLTADASSISSSEEVEVMLMDNWR